MSGSYGNFNLAFVGGSQFLTIDGTSDTITCPTDTQAVSLYSDTPCWVTFGAVPVAAAPGAEKTNVVSFFLPSGVVLDYPVPQGSDAVPTKVAAIQDSAGGTLYVTFRKV